MGILNPKTRVMDVVMTPTGREALARGGLKIAYATLSDGHAFYDPGSVTGSYDTATDRLYLEAMPQQPQNILSLVTDDTGKLIPASAFGTKIGSDGTLYKGSSVVKGLTSGSDFSSAISGIVDLFKNSLQYNTVISSADPLDDTPNFILNPTSGFFKIDNSMSKEIEVSSVNQADSLFFDKRFANNPQFKFLPPVAETTTGSVEIAEFNNIKEYNSLTYEDLKSEIFGTDANPIKQRIDIQVQDTSLDNDMVAQFFEVSPNGLTKLDAVDFGEAFDSTDREHPRKRIVFFGKVFLDDTQTATFINLFTVVFD
jgi:hypothetical protein